MWKPTHFSASFYAPFRVSSSTSRPLFLPDAAEESKAEGDTQPDAAAEATESKDDWGKVYPPQKEELGKWKKKQKSKKVALWLPRAKAVRFYLFVIFCVAMIFSCWGEFPAWRFLAQAHILRTWWWCCCLLMILKHDCDADDEKELISIIFCDVTWKVWQLVIKHPTGKMHI